MEINTMPKIDIVMAAFNGGKYISEQIQSILDQDYINFRLLIADDCSQDSTRAIIETYASKDSRIEIILNPEQFGVKRNFEQLLSKVTSSYFMLADQDDIWFKSKISTSLNAIIKQKSLLVYADLKIVDQERKLIHNSYWTSSNIKPVSGNNWRLLMTQNIVTGCTIIADKNLLDYALPFPENIVMHDSWLAINAAVYGSINFISDPLIEYRQHEDNAVGANHFLKQGLMSEILIAGISYNKFLVQRAVFLKKQFMLVESYKKRFEHIKHIYTELDFFSQALRKFKNISLFDSTLTGIKTKKKFKSQGILRNVWWVLIYSYPLFAFLLAELLILIKTLRGK